jgi:hypothetical protein
MSNADMPAMPFQELDSMGNPFGYMSWGLTKREYFAAHAPDMPEGFNSRHPELNQMARMVAWRYAYADAMLAEGK